MGRSVGGQATITKRLAVPSLPAATRENRTPASITLISAALDCPDAGDLAAFYAEITGGKVIFSDDRWATVQGPGVRIDFQTAPRYVPPTWPDSASSMQMHLDFYVDDPDGAEAQVLAAGASKVAYQPGDHFRVYTDPAGHPFCLCTEDLPGQG